MADKKSSEKKPAPTGEKQGHGAMVLPLTF